jgi:hypothetical protein
MFTAFMTALARFHMREVCKDFEDPIVLELAFQMPEKSTDRPFIAAAAVRNPTSQRKPQDRNGCHNHHRDRDRAGTHVHVSLSFINSLGMGMGDDFHHRWNIDFYDACRFIFPSSLRIGCQFPTLLPGGGWGGDG